MNRFFLALMLGVGLAAGQAHAGHRHQHADDFVDYAKVVDVEPISRSVSRRVPRERCWTEQVAEAYPRQHGGSYTNEIIGGVIGGAIGNAIGHNKSNRKVQAVIGAALGASIAHDLERRNYQPASIGYREVERCALSHEVEYHEEIIGYRVTYRYHGQTYHTRMDRHPGKRIPVRVDVQPL